MPETVSVQAAPAVQSAPGGQGPTALIPVDRAVGDLRRGGFVVLHGSGGAAALVQAAETAEDGALQRLRGLCSGVPVVALTVQRAAALGLPHDGEAVVTRTLDPTVPAEALHQLADPTAEPALTLPDVTERGALPPGFAEAGVELAKLAHLLPAVVMGLVLPATEPELAVWAVARGLLTVRLRDILGYRAANARSLRRVSEARVPLLGAEDARIVAFRPGDGSAEHLAIIIGRPSPAEAVLTRLHSECFTGDRLGSLRCDCGDQLRGAIEQIGRAGAGVLLYLAQEGRGIGLVNKLRAYALQDRGADTLEANLQLGFDPDERVYLPAAEMLRQLGFRRVRLMTNNPDKVASLARCGIEVSERVPHVFPANAHNDRYLET
ncbi:MAG: GTP cyclohydrolase II RibA, partial [Rhodospirillaceae bacterium]|nr:GTP cyclohydrolase II RibA [Rhodospirillaceae bacterium]